MDFNLKNYQIFRLKKYFKKNEFFFLFHTAKLNLDQWVNKEQTLKKLKLSYYKPLNGTSLITLKNSVYRNFRSIIGGFVLFVNLNYKKTNLDIKSILSSLKPSFVLVSVKLNNKVYSTSQFKGLKSLSYKKNMLNLYKVMDNSLKTSYILTDNKNDFRNNVT
jgi:hypothetical protein